MKVTDGKSFLHDRVRALDDAFTSENPAVAGQDPGRSDVRDAENFICVLDEATSAGDLSDTPVINSADADAIVAKCSLIQRLGSAEPALVTADIEGCPQYWISTGKPPWVSPRISELSPEHFVPADRRDWTRNVKPFGVGLYTSTGFRKTQGMWRLYLDLGKYSSNFPKPWHVWKLNHNENARVCNVATAAQWQDLILSHPVANQNLIYPDWGAIAEEWDSIHITISAIAAIQGMRLQTHRGFLAPSYWDVETTFWLRWSFTSVTLMETIASLDALACLPRTGAVRALSCTDLDIATEIPRRHRLRAVFDDLALPM